LVSLFGIFPSSIRTRTCAARFFGSTPDAKAEENNRQLKASVDALRFDPKALERLAREQLGYAKPGETVIRFDPPNFRR